MWSRECYDAELIPRIIGHNNTFYTSFGGNMENKINNGGIVFQY